MKSLLLLGLFLLVFFVNAQLPQDLSKYKSSDISDAQLQDYLQKASASGYSDAQMEQEFLKRGLPSAEMSRLKDRIQGMSAKKETSIPNTPAGGRSVSSNSISSNTSRGNGGPIFGSELFSNPSSSFEPSINIPTPKNYTLGYGDKLLLDVFGINLSQQNLDVNAEGTVSVKYAGPIYVNGLTIDEASKRINAKLGKIYPAIQTGQTKALLSLSAIRTIKVMVFGAVQKPGTYSVSSLSTLYNVLYLSGGPTDNGSFRNIEVIRNSKKILTADLYDFLLRGDQKGNIRIEDGDLIRIPFVKLKVTLNGEVNRPAIFEVQENETLKDVINFAGNFKSTAYKARITGTRLTDFDKQRLDITKDSIAIFKPQNGDEYTVTGIIDRFQNRVTIEGTVFKPGDYSFERGMTIGSLLKKSEGLREDAYKGRAIVVRTKDDLTKEYITLNLYKDSAGQNFLLQKEDVVQVLSIFDIKDQFTVTINGAVRTPGTFNFEDSLSLKTLILKAGGFAENATGNGITIARRKKDVDVNNPNSPIVELIEINDIKELTTGSTDIILKPFDIVSVKTNPYYKNQISVAVTGEVLSPGNFSLLSRVEKISDLIKRAGGVLYTANISGARLRRKNNLYDIDTKTVKKIAESSAKDSSGVTIEAERKPYNEIAIDLPKILQNPGSKEDILLEEGDVVFIPTVNNMVSVSGEVFKPLDISFDSNKSFKDYLSDAGGVTNSSNKRRMFVIYPNGKAAKIKHFLFFKKYPEITAGTKIFVPKEAEKKATDIGKVGLIVSSVSALITAIALAYQITK